MKLIFSSAVFEVNVEVLSNPSSSSAAATYAKTLTFPNISVFTKNIYLKHRLVVYYQKGNHTSKGDNRQIVFYIVMPLFDLEFSKSSCSRALVLQAVFLLVLWVRTTEKKECGY